MIVACESAGDLRIDLVIYRSVSSHIVGGLTGTSCFGTLLFHCCTEAFLVHAAAFLLEDLFGQIQREAVGIVESERIFSIESGLSFLLHGSFQIGKDA